MEVGRVVTNTSDHLTRLLNDIDATVRGAAPTEASVLRAALTVEAIFKAMEGDVPTCVRELVSSLSRSLERIAFTTDGERLATDLARAYEQYREALEHCAPGRIVTEWVVVVEPVLPLESEEAFASWLADHPAISARLGAFDVRVDHIRGLGGHDLRRYLIRASLLDPI